MNAADAVRASAQAFDATFVQLKEALRLPDSEDSLLIRARDACTLAAAHAVEALTSGTTNPAGRAAPERSAWSKPPDLKADRSRRGCGSTTARKPMA